MLKGRHAANTVLTCLLRGQGHRKYPTLFSTSQTKCITPPALVVSYHANNQSAPDSANPSLPNRSPNHLPPTTCRQPLAPTTRCQPLAANQTATAPALITSYKPAFPILVGVRYLHLLIIDNRYDSNFNPVLNMLCQACENIFRGDFHGLHSCSEYLATLHKATSFLDGTGFTSETNYRAHQPDFLTLYQSALKECWICTQIFKDVCKEYKEEYLFPQNLTLAEIAKRILEATTEAENANFISGNFSAYLLTGSQRVDGSDMALFIRVESIHSPRLGSYKYNLADQRGMLINAD